MTVGFEPANHANSGEYSRCFASFAGPLIITSSKLMQLPLDAEVDYFPDFLTSVESKRLYDAVLASSDLSDVTIGEN